MDVKYRFALIGCGQISHRHAKQIARVGVLAAVCDTDPEKANRLAKESGAQPFYSLETLLQHADTFDVATICTPNYLHAPQSIRCLNAALHVICEKPMCIATKEAEAVIEAIKSSGKKFFVVKQNRFNPPVVLVRRLLEENKLGKLHSFQVNCFWNRGLSYYNSSWKGKKTLDGGTLFTQFSHFIDLLIWFFGEEQSVQLMSDNYILGNAIEFEDTGSALIRMKSGAIGSLNFTITSCQKNMEGSITLFGEKGTVKIGGQYLNTLDYFEVEGEPQQELPPGNTANNYGSYQGSMSNHDKVYDQVILALNNRAHDLVEGEEAAKTVRMIERLYSSLKS